MIKNIRSTQKDLDDLDLVILRILQTAGNLSMAALARQVHLSQPAVTTRVKRLEEDGFIQRYAAVLNREKLGYDLVCLVQIRMRVHRKEAEENFRAEVNRIPEVLECFHLTGEYDYLLKVVVKDRQGLEEFVNSKLTPMLAQTDARIQTSLVLSEIKSTTSLL